jgi:hypothetical protein
LLESRTKEFANGQFVEFKRRNIYLKFVH